MTQDPLKFAPLVEPPNATVHRSGRVVLAGVAAACTLGIGLGLWARPAPDLLAETARPAASAAAATRPVLQIVVDDTPAPLGAPLEVLPRDAVPAQPFTSSQPALAVPVRPAAGLVRVDAEVAVEPRPLPKPLQAPAVKRTKVETQALKEERPRPTRINSAEAPPKAKPARIKSKPEVRAAAKSRPARPDKPKAIQVAKASSKPSPKPQATKARKKVELAASAGREREAKTARPSAEPPPKVDKAKASPPRAKPAPRGEGPMRVAQARPCASEDPGEAVVCADRRLGARDRQLQQAYRNAEAAGVPAAALRRQQARWLEARAAAAREAPWAVEDVYVARISELNDLTRDAREN